MAQGFIKIKEERIRKNIIKHYQPYGEKKLNLYYNSSRYKLEVQTFEDEGLKYIKWAEHRLFEELNQNKEIEEFMINDCYSNGE
jgi:hypothetical protein